MKDRSSAPLPSRRRRYSRSTKFHSVAMAAPSRPGDREQCFLDLCHGVVSHGFQFDMRKVGQFVCCHYGIDNRRAIDRERFADGSFQLAGLRGLEAVAAASAGKWREVRIGGFDALL